MTRRLVTHERLLSLLDYDKETGVFRWKDGCKQKGAQAGRACTCRDHQGYIKIGVEYRSYYAARLAWFYVTGEWPKHEIDHKNGDRSDDRFENLREATRGQNLANCRGRRRGLKGAYYVKRKNYWKSQICVNKKQYHLGHFGTEQEAHDAYVAAAQRLRGEFARWA